MTIYRRRAKRDTAEPAILEALHAAGALYMQVSGAGVPDVTALYNGQVFLLEIKTGKKKETPEQIKRRQTWGNAIKLVRTPAEALAALGISPVEIDEILDAIRLKMITGKEKKQNGKDTRYAHKSAKQVAREVQISYLDDNSDNAPWIPRGHRPADTD